MTIVSDVTLTAFLIASESAGIEFGRRVEEDKTFLRNVVPIHNDTHNNVPAGSRFYSGLFIKGRRLQVDPKRARNIDFYNSIYRSINRSFKLLLKFSHLHLLELKRIIPESRLIM
jgi:hypothetical protein